MSLGLASVGLNPLGVSPWSNTAAKTPVRALVLINGAIRQITDAQIGTGLRPLVIMSDGKLKERSESEGVPLIISAGFIRCMNTSTETLQV